MYGTDVALGVTDFFQVGTSVIRDIYRVFNVNAKLSLLDFPEFALSPTLGFETYNYHDISSTNPDLRVTAWLPGVVAAVRLDPRLALFVGGNLNLTQTKLVTGDGVKSGFIRGAAGEADLSWAYNPPDAEESRARKRSATGLGNVLSAGVSYDFTYRILGLGVSHHWPGFHVGLHYYPGVDHNPIQPILAGGGSVDL